MALHLLQHDRDGALRLASALSHAATSVRHCERCNTFTEDTLCALCRSAKRDAALLCVVETPADLLMAWRKEYGRGRVFYTSLGHREEVWQDARFRQHLLGGLRWALWS